MPDFSPLSSCASGIEVPQAKVLTLPSRKSASMLWPPFPLDIFGFSPKAACSPKSVNPCYTDVIWNCLFSVLVLNYSIEHLLWFLKHFFRALYSKKRRYEMCVNCGLLWGLDCDGPWRYSSYLKHKERVLTYRYFNRIAKTSIIRTFSEIKFCA